MSLKRPGQLGYCRYIAPRCPDDTACECHSDKVGDEGHIAGLESRIAALEESASSYRSALQMAEEKCRHFDTGPEHNVSMCVICDQASAYSKQIDHAPDCPFSRLKEPK